MSNKLKKYSKFKILELNYEHYKTHDVSSFNKMDDKPKIKQFSSKHENAFVVVMLLVLVKHYLMLKTNYLHFVDIEQGMAHAAICKAMQQPNDYRHVFYRPEQQIFLLHAQAYVNRLPVCSTGMFLLIDTLLFQQTENFADATISNDCFRTYK